MFKKIVTRENNIEQCERSMIKRLIQRWREKYPHGFVVYGGRMSSTGSSGATFIGHNSPRREEVEPYRSTSGIGNVGTLTPSTYT